VVFYGLIIFALLCLWLAFPAKAHDETPQFYNMTTQLCGDTESIERNLGRKYHEFEGGYGVDPKGRIIRLFISDKTFTMLSTAPGGMTCIIAVGDTWETTHEKPGEKL
jgi:hypothetical protein